MHAVQSTEVANSVSRERSLLSAQAPSSITLLADHSFWLESHKCTGAAPHITYWLCTGGSSVDEVAHITRPHAGSFVTDCSYSSYSIGDAVAGSASFVSAAEAFRNAATVSL